MTNKFFLLFLIFVLLIFSINKLSASTKDNWKINLSGEWRFQIDSLNVGISGQWFNNKLSEKVKLPGSMTENGKGNDVSVKTKWTGQVVDQSWYTDEKYAKYRKPGNVKIPFWLQPEKHYIGAAWYQKEIEIPENWNGKRTELTLERCHWETIVWINDKKVGVQNSLATAHVYDLTGFLSPGKHQLTIRVDNRVKEIDPGQNSHSISDHTQSNWNGIAGKMSIEAFSPVYFENVKLYPDVAGKKVVVKLNLKNQSGKKQQCKLGLSAIHSDHSPYEQVKEFELSENKELQIEYPMGDNPLLWDEFHPNVYSMNLKLECPAGAFSKQINFGMREYKVDGTRFTINQRPVFLRGTLECAIFPKTGYPATDVEEWIRIFKVIKAHGLNHMRFHSWCPPEAAFIAADKVGIYLQVECSSWANQGSSLGDGKPIDDWIYKEAEQILDDYGNHPSFCMMAYGNEPGGKNQSKFLSTFVSHWKENDPRRVYTSGAGWPPIPEMDYYNSPDPRIQRWGAGLRSLINSKPPQTNFDYRDILAKKFADKPTISHEIGQWCAYPNFKEMKKYTGVLKAKNFEIFKETLEENQMGHLADDFLLASGKLQALCYKADIEAALRTPGMAGFQLLDLHDFPGQGTALVGVLDAFWEEKGYISPEEYRHFCNQTVPLARFEKRVFLNNEKIRAEIEVAHFGDKTLENITPAWKLIDEKNNIIFEDKLNQANIPIGNGIKLGKIEVDAGQLETPQKLILTVDVSGYSNQWDIWVYPAKQEAIDLSQIYVTSVLDDKAVDRLENGGKVLLSFKKGSLKPEKGGGIKVGFSSIFWNTAWTRKQAPHTLGILCNPAHPALDEFPTEFHSNWQWWDAMSHSHAIILDEFSDELLPIVRIIDDWFENRRLALIFEAKVGNGKLVVSGIDLMKNMENRPEARQMLYSIQKYMISEEFDPQVELDFESIQSL
ncbi:beta-galactosidase [candidate division KSB1 bacterium]|nr:beta-galactosidase [candidate division KSB1 bacterium]